MNLHTIKILRRWLIGIIIFVSLAVVSNYLMFRHKPTTSAPAKILSSEMTQTAEGIEYSDNKNGITRFKIDARRLIETRDGKSFLEGIEAYDFDSDGSIHNEIHSHRAVYDKEHKSTDFAGNVQLFLGKGTVIRTESLQYDLNTNTGSSPGALQLHSRTTNGTARGMRLDKERESLELCSAVDLIFNRKKDQSGAPVGSENMRAVSDRAYIEGEQNHIVFQGKARIETMNSESLSGDVIEVILSPDHARVVSLTASGPATYQKKDKGESRVLSGDRMHFSIGKSGVLENIHVLGQAAFISNAAPYAENLTGGRIDLEFDGLKGAISQIQGFDDVQFRMNRGKERVLISGGHLDAQFAAETGKLTHVRVVNDAKFLTESTVNTAGQELQSSQIQLRFRQGGERMAIETLRADGSVHWLSIPPEADAAANREPARELDAASLEMKYSGDGDFLESGAASGGVSISESTEGNPRPSPIRRILADSVRFQFFQKGGQIKNMNAEGHVKITHENGRPDLGNDTITNSFRTTSDHMATAFALKDGRSAIKSATQWGNFTFQNTAYSATAGKCEYDAGKGILVLSDSPRISDDRSATTGERIQYDQNQKKLLVQGKVKSQINTQNGNGSFIGNPHSATASPSIIMADELEYRTESGEFRYSGKVRSISENQQLNAQVLEIFNDGGRIEALGDVWNLVIENAQAEKPNDARDFTQSPITIRSNSLRYSKENNQIVYLGNVHVSSADMSLSSNSFNAYLDRDGTIQRAIAKGKVHIAQTGGRESRSDVANWLLDAGRFEIEGTPAEVFDPARGRSQAPRLTYFKANDRILLGK
jgi:LPS export ABC transporter protein LptC